MLCENRAAPKMTGIVQIMRHSIGEACAQQIGGCKSGQVICTTAMIPYQMGKSGDVFNHCSLSAMWRTPLAFAWLSVLIGATGRKYNKRLEVEKLAHKSNFFAFTQIVLQASKQYTTTLR